ncbi:ABC transporter ATP-binding protein [Bacteroides sp. 51]|nr:ABC transporter ATP-binding protein [Bacteroides sp. 51]NDV83796.1 ABC transporter ATP-binding protein [Bacteroides sp. 51]
MPRLSSYLHISSLRRQFKWLWQVSAGQRKRIAITCLTGIAGVAFSLAFIWTSKQVIDIATGTTEGSLWEMGVVTVILLILQLSCNVLESWLNSRMQVEGGNTLRRRLFARLLQSRWNELERFHTGDVINRVEQDTNAIISLLTGTVPAFITTGIQLLASFIFFCMLDKALPWLLIGILPIFLLASRFYIRRMRKYTREIRHSDSRIQSVIQESLQHRTVIKTLEQGDRHLEKLDDLQRTLRTQVFDRTKFSLFSRSMVALAFSGGYLIAFLWGAVRLSVGSMTFGTMTAFLQLVSKLQRPALDVVRMIPAFINALTAIERLMELEALPAEEMGDRIRFEETPELTLQDITFRYKPEDKPIFEHFSLDFPAGSQTAIMGETGKGKTTLIRLLLALATPQEGSIRLRNSSMEAEISPLTRCNFIYVPQGNTLFSGTIRDNLLMGNPEATEEEMKEALHTAVADYVFSLPDGMDTILNELGGGLSEGQAQRISIARALLRPGSILLFDEATSALDPETEKLLVENLRSYGQGKTVIFVTHHPALAEACERTYYL